MSLRVAVVTQDEPFHMPAFFETFFESLPEEVTIESVTILNLLNDSTIDLAKRMYDLYGPWNFVRRVLEFSYLNLLAAVGNRYSVSNVAGRYGINVETRSTVNDPAFVSSLRQADIDILLSVSAAEVFDSMVLEAPNWGCLNVHTAKLPKYRGLLPTFWALYHGDDDIGVTVHTMAEKIDHGEIVRQTTFPVAEEDTLDEVIHRGKLVGGELTAKALSDIANNAVTLKPMTGESSYHSFPSAEDRRELQRRGREVL